MTIQDRLNILKSINITDPILVKYLNHLNKHKDYVSKICNKLGIKQLGIDHDVDKYDLNRINAYANFWQNDNPTEEDIRIYKLHKNSHRLQNKHHPQYWYDKTEVMDFESFLEMLADWVGSGLTNDKKYTPRNTLKYYLKNNINLLKPLPQIKSAAEEWMKLYAAYGIKYIDRDKIKSIYDKYVNSQVSEGDIPGVVNLNNFSYRISKLFK